MLKQEDIYIYIYIYIFCPAFDDQEQWRTSGFNRRNFSHLTEKYSKGKLLVFDDRQLDTKRNKLIEKFYLRGRHNKNGIIQCEQFTQATSHLEKTNTDYFVLISPFSEYTAQYYHEKVIPTLSTKNIWKLGLLADEKSLK